MTAATTRPVPRPPAGGAAFGALYRLLLRNQATPARLVAVAALGAVGVLIGLAAGLDPGVDSVSRGTRFVNGYGLTVVVPVVSLLFSSAVLGDLVDDRTLVYVWMRPVHRGVVAAAAAAAALTICLPTVVVPLVLAAALTGAGQALIGGTAVAAAVGIVGYVGVFEALGLRFRRALVWGLAYILLWEGFVANASTTSSRLSLRAYTRSILSTYTGVPLDQADMGIVVAIVVPVLVSGVFVALTARLLRRATVD